MVRVKSTMFPTKKIQRLPNGQHINQVDYVLVNAGFSNIILDAKTICGADGDSDHFLMVDKYECILV